MQKRNKQNRPNPQAVGTDTGTVTSAPIMNQTENPKLRLENITYIYGKNSPFEVRALDGVSLDIHAGKLTGIIGHTGSGKSTLIQLLNGLTRAESGRVLLDGEDIWARPKEIGKVRFRVGMVMQYPEYQLFEETVAADIAFGPKNMKLSEEEIRERVAESAAFAGVDPALMDKSPFDLSGGWKRRVAIAGVMAMRPKILILDEATSALDNESEKLKIDSIQVSTITEDKFRVKAKLGANHSRTEDIVMIADKIFTSGVLSVTWEKGDE